MSVLYVNSILQDTVHLWNFKLGY